MNWRYGLIEYQDKEGAVDCYSVIEVYDMEGEKHSEDDPERMWAEDCKPIGDTPQSLIEVLEMMKNDIALHCNFKPDVVRKGKTWWWADAPERVYDDDKEIF